MNTRTVGDYIRSAFLARDKATCDAIVKDAEAAIPPELAAAAAKKNGNGHEEPDGDEGDNSHKTGAKVGGVHVHIENPGDSAPLGVRVTRLEDGLKSIDGKLSKVLDSIAAAAKDGELPPWLKKGNGEGDDEEKTEDDVESPDGELGAQTAEKLTAAEPDLMEADPALKTGPSKMGDAVFVEHVQKGVRKLIKDLRARAEILSPGFQCATIDAKPGATTADALCSMRRGALRAAAGTVRGQKALGRFSADAVETMSCALVRSLFLDASDRMREMNNAPSGQYHAMDETFASMDAQRDKLKDINAKNSAFWSKQLGSPRIN